MEKLKFNPEDWLPKQDKPVNPIIPPQRINNPSSDLYDEVDKVIDRIEAAFEDITTCYADWLNVGFAFAHEFGEGGRKNFHRVSRFYNGYTRAETDKQFDNCLKSTGHGITIKTFFHMAKQAGIEVRGRGSEGTMGRGSDGVMGRRDEGTETDSLATGIIPSDSS